MHFSACPYIAHAPAPATALASADSLQEVTVLVPGSPSQSQLRSCKQAFCPHQLIYLGDVILKAGFNGYVHVRFLYGQ